MSDGRTLREQAVALASAGFRVFPLVPNGKKPAFDDWQNLASDSPGRVHRLWSEALSADPLDYNVGIATGRGLLVLDVDNKNGKHGSSSLEALELRNDDLPATLTVRTPTDGEHRYFAVAAEAWVRNSISTLGEGIDIKGDGGYVVAPGSVIDGVPYVVAEPLPPAGAPEWFAGMVVGPKPERSTAIIDAEHLDTEDAIARATNWLVNHAEIAVEGDGGNTTAYKVAARVLDFGVTPITALDLLLEHWDHRCSPPWGEQLQAMIDNAAQYRQNAIGSASADVEFDVVELATSSKMEPVQNADDMPALSGNQPWLFESAADAAASALNQSAKPLIEGLLDQGAMSMLYAPPGAGKTFVTIDLLYHISAGKPWAGRKVAKGLAVHLAAEGGGGVRKRYKAYDVTYGCGPDLPLVLISVSADLRSNKVDCNRLIATIRAAEAHFGMPCSILAIDTMSRVMAGGDENSSVDGGALVKNIDEVRAAIKAHTMLIHHTGKNDAKGARGWSGFKAALDTELEIKDGALHVTKQRDLEFAPPIPFSLKSVDLGRDVNGNPVSSAVVELGTALEDFNAVLSVGEEGVFDALNAAAAIKFGTNYKIGDEKQFIQTEEWFRQWVGKSTVEATVEGSFDGRSRQNFGTFRRGLEEYGLIKQIKRSQWVRLK